MDHDATVRCATVLTYALNVATSPGFVIDENVLRSMHFMLLEHDLGKSPGRYRESPIYVRDDQRDANFYDGRDWEQVPALMGELSRQLSESTPDDPLVRGAMAHLNLVMIHPFRDGNGRMARALQTIQAQTLQRRFREAEAQWDHIDRIVSQHRLPDRIATALFDATLGLRVTRPSYLKHAEVDERTGTRDLVRAAQLGLLEAHGERRGRYYLAGTVLSEAQDDLRSKRSRPTDPYPELLGQVRRVL